MRINLSLAWVVVCMLFLFAAVSAYAAGGIFLDNLEVRNNGKVVFADNFDDGNINDWVMKSGATVVFDKPNQPHCALLLNTHFNNGAGARRCIELTDPGVVELNAWIFVTPAEEQYRWSKKNEGCNIYIGLYTGNQTTAGNRNDPVIRAYVNLLNGEKVCRVGVNVTNANLSGSDCGKGSRPILETGKWAFLTLRIDQKTGTASVLLDNQSKASINYDPSYFPMFKEVNLLSNFGDGSKRTD